LKYNFIAVARKYTGRGLRIAPEIGVRGLAAIMAVLALFGFNPQSLAATSTWTGSSGASDFNTAADWNGTAVGSGNLLDFTSANASSTASLNDDLTAGFSIGGITFASGSPAYTITGNSITLNGGITNSGANLETINDAIALGAAETVTTASGGGNIALGGIISGGFGLTAAGTGGLTLSGANTFTGGLTIQSGTVTATTSNAALGAAADSVTLGFASGSSAATLLVGSTGLTYANPIVLASTDTGTLTIGNTGTTIATTFSGGVTGSNNLTINNSATTGDITFSTGSINNAGTITNTGSGITGNLNSTSNTTVLQGTTLITGVIGANVTNVIENSATSDLYLGAVNSSYTGNITITNGTVLISSHASALGSGAGTVVFGASGSNNTAGLIFGGRLNNTTGAAETYSNPISILGTGINFISATDYGPTFSGAVTLNSNTLVISVNNSGGSGITLSGGVTGTGNIIANNAVTTVSNAGESINFTTHPVNNSGTITFTNTAFNGGPGSNGAGTGTGVVANSITGGVGSNVTGITTNSGSEPLNITTTGITVNSGGTTLTNNNTNTVATNSQSGTTGLFTVSSAVGGTGNLILDNNSSITSGLT
jgi:hypothetical protein